MSFLLISMEFFTTPVSKIQDYQVQHEMKLNVPLNQPQDNKVYKQIQLRKKDKKHNHSQSLLVLWPGVIIFCPYNLSKNIFQIIITVITRSVQVLAFFKSQLCPHRWTSTSSSCSTITQLLRHIMPMIPKTDWERSIITDLSELELYTIIPHPSQAKHNIVT